MTQSTPTPRTGRARVWNLLRTARLMGRTSLTVATVATALATTPESVLQAVLPDLMECGGHGAPALYCDPTGDGVALTPRRYPIPAPRRRG
jgi:hypothetical protein